MSLNGAWETNEDFERDLLLFAEYSVAIEQDNVPEEVDETESPFDVPESIRNYEQRMEENKQSAVAGTNFDESLTYFVSGRGRGVMDRIIRPGEPVKPDPNDDVELKKMIRQVSGLGYSNELIERHIKSKYDENDAKAAGTSSSDADESAWEVCKPTTSLESAASSVSALPKEVDVVIPEKESHVKKNKKKGKKSTYATSVKSTKVEPSPQWFESYLKPKDYNLDSDFPPLK